MRSLQFRWNGSLPTDDQVGADPATYYSGDYGEQWAYQACQPVAAMVLEAIRVLRFETGEPDFVVSGWRFVVWIDGQPFWVMVQWVGPERETFNLDASIQRGCIASLFLKRPDEAALSPIRKLLWQALSKHPQIHDLSWVDPTD